MLGHLPLTKEKYDAMAVEPSLSECTASPEFLSAFNKRAVQVSCNDDEVLFRIGELGTGVYLVRSGQVGLILPVSSTDGIGFRAETGSLIGLPAAFSNEPYSMTAIAWKGSEIAVMRRDRTQLNHRTVHDSSPQFPNPARRWPSSSMARC